MNPEQKTAPLRLDSPLQYLKGVGPKRAELLGRLGLHTVADLLAYYPFRHEDRSLVLPISKLTLGCRATIRGRVMRVTARRTRRRMVLVQAHIEDDTGAIIATWFNIPYLKDRLHRGDELYLTGKVDAYKGLQMVSPEFEIIGQDEEGLFAQGLIPFYSLTDEVPQSLVRRVAHKVVHEMPDEVADFLPDDFRTPRHLMPRREALKGIHFPASQSELDGARHRLVYEEFLLLELLLARRRAAVKSVPKPYPKVITPQVDERIRRLFPFALTSCQERVIEEIATDLGSRLPMHRLLQGDVGAGKTVVAIYAMLVTVAAKQQAALLAPTEILAEQHFLTLSQMLAQARVKMALLGGGVAGKERGEILSGLADGSIHLVIGTHALLEADVIFSRLGLCVIDEQHKFGVLQRAKLRDKGPGSDCLVMTATPIPRTLTMTIFGDLEVSILRTKPAGRLPIITRSGPESRRPGVYDFIRKQLAQGRQAYFVSPLVEESEELELTGATELHQKLCAEFPEFRVGLLHGRLRAEEKDQVMRQFKAGEFHLLACTVVIEVGIDVPNASVMAVEHAERFGLATLHQLRGRVGRGAGQSYCFLLSPAGTLESRARMRIMVETDDGFRIAEEDLRLRGPGEIWGTRQHGLPALTIGDLLRDQEVLERARQDAFDLVQADPGLEADAFHRELDCRVRARGEVGHLGLVG